MLDFKENYFFSENPSYLSKDKLLEISNTLVKNSNLEDFLHSKEIIYGSSFVLIIFIKNLPVIKSTKLEEDLLNISENRQRNILIYGINDSSQKVGQILKNTKISL